MSLLHLVKRVSSFILSEKVYQLTISMESAVKILPSLPFEVITSPQKNGGLKVVRKSLFLPSVYSMHINKTPGGAIVRIHANRVERVISVVFLILLLVVASGGLLAAVLRMLYDGSIGHALIGMLMPLVAILILMWLKFVFLILRLMSRVKSIVNHFEGVMLCRAE